MATAPDLLLSGSYGDAGADAGGVAAPTETEEERRRRQRAELDPQNVGYTDPSTGHFVAPDWFVPGSTFTGNAGEAVAGALGNVVRGAAQIPIGAVRLAADLPAQVLGMEARPGQAMQEAVDETFQVDPALDRTFLGGSLPQGLGSMAGFALPMVGLAGKAGTIATAALGAVTQAGQGIQESQEAGGTSGQSALAALLNIPLGATEALPLTHYGGAALKGLEKIAPDVVARTVARALGKFGGTAVGHRVAGMAAQAGEESAQEIGQQIGGNWVARSGAGYDPNRDLGEGVAEAGGVAAILGGVMGGAMPGHYEGNAKDSTESLKAAHRVLETIPQELGAKSQDAAAARGIQAEIERELRRRGEGVPGPEAEIPFEDAGGEAAGQSVPVGETVSAGNGRLLDEHGQPLAPGVLMPDGTARLTGPGVDLRGPDEMGPPAPATAGSALETLLGLGGEPDGNIPGVGGEVPSGGVDARERAGGGEGGGVGTGLGGAEGDGAPVAARMGQGVSSGPGSAGVGAEGEVTATATVPHGGAALPGAALPGVAVPGVAVPGVAVPETRPLVLWQKRVAVLDEAAAGGHVLAQRLLDLGRSSGSGAIVDQVNQEVASAGPEGEAFARSVLRAGGRDFNAQWELNLQDYTTLATTAKQSASAQARALGKTAKSERMGAEVAGELADNERTPQDRFEQAKMSARARANEIPAQVAGHSAQVARLTAQAKANKGKAVKGGTFKTTIAAEQVRIKALNEEYTRLLTPAYEADLRVRILGETPEVAQARAMADRPAAARPSTVAAPMAGAGAGKPLTLPKSMTAPRAVVATTTAPHQGDLASGGQGATRTAQKTPLGQAAVAEPLTLEQARRVVTKGDQARLNQAKVDLQKKGLKGPRLRAALWDAATPAQRVIERDRRMKIAERKAKQPVSDDNFVTWLAGVGRMSPGKFHVDNQKTGKGHWTTNELADQLGFDPNTTKRTPFWNNLFVGRNGRGLALDELTEALQEHARTMHLFGNGEGGYDSRATTLDILTDLAYKGWDGVSKPATDGEVLDHQAMQDDDQAAFEDYAAETERHSQETAQRLLGEGGLSKERHAALGEALASAKAGDWSPIMRELPRATKEMGEEEYRFQAAYSPRSPHLQTPLPPSGLRSESLEFLGKNGEDVVNESAEARAKLPPGEIARRMERIRAQSESRHAYRVAHPEEFPNGKLQAAPERIIHDLEPGLRQRARELGESAERVKMRHAPERATGRAWEMAQEVADRVGTRLVPVEQAGSEPLLFNGFTPSRVRGTMLLNVDGAQNPLSLVVGHEALHQIADELGRDHPMVKRLFSLLWEATKNKGDMFEKYSRAYGRSDGEFVIEEFAGDALAQAIHSPGFWRRVAAKDMGLFARLWAAVKRMMGWGGQVGTSDLGAAQAGAMYDAEALMTEAGIGQVRTAMEALYREYVATKRGRVWARVEARLAEGRAQANRQGERLKAKGKTTAEVVDQEDFLGGKSEKSVGFPERKGQQSDLLGYTGPELADQALEERTKGPMPSEGQFTTPDLFGRLEASARKPRPRGPQTPDLFGGKMQVAERDQVGMYSQVERTVAESKQGVGSGEQWAAWVAKQPGVKAEEMEWLGLEPWLKGQKKVSREAIVQFVREQSPRVEEVGKGRKNTPPPNYRVWQKPTADGSGLWYVKTAQGITLTEGVATKDAAERLRVNMERYAVEKDTTAKFEQYKEEGGTNYRETLLTLPENPGEFKGQHWDEKNVVVHLRTDERALVESGLSGLATKTRTPVLFVEEVQSDWHEQGRKEGYRNEAAVLAATSIARQAAARHEELLSRFVGENPDLERFLHLAMDDLPFGPPEGTPKEEQAALALEQLEKRALEDDVRNAGLTMDQFYDLGMGGKYGISRAPWSKSSSWGLLAMKQAIRQAVDGGQEVVAWTTGAQQNERYDLGHTVKRVHVYKNVDGLRVTVDTHAQGSGIEIAGLTDGVVDVATVERFLGKDFARRVEEQPNGDHSYTGLELSVGGDGMKGFYDQILPSVVQKYVKQWGGRVANIEVSDVGVVHGFEITAAMRDAVAGEGQVRFQMAGDKVDRSDRIDRGAGRRSEAEVKARDAALREAMAAPKNVEARLAGSNGINDKEGFWARAKRKTAAVIQKWGVEARSPLPYIEALKRDLEKPWAVQDAGGKVLSRYKHEGDAKRWIEAHVPSGWWEVRNDGKVVRKFTGTGAEARANAAATALGPEARAWINSAGVQKVVTEAHQGAMNELFDRLLGQRNHRARAAIEAWSVVNGFIAGLDDGQADLFRRMAYARDLQGYIAQQQKDEPASAVLLPHGWAQAAGEADEDGGVGALEEWAAKIEALVAADPKVSAALQKRTDYWEAMGKRLEAAGLLQKGQATPNYLRHMLLRDWANLEADTLARMAGGGSGDRLKQAQGKGWQERRNRSREDYNTDVTQVDLLSSEDMTAAVLDAELIQWVKNNKDLNERWKYEAQAKKANAGREEGQKEVCWQDLVRESRPDLSLWRINPGIRWFQMQSVPEGIARQALLDAFPNMEEVGVSHKYLELAIPNGLARQFNDIQNSDWLGTQSVMASVLRPMNKAWKSWILTAPHHSIRYGLNNLIGDLEKVIAAAPDVLKGKEDWKATFEDLWEYFAHAKVSARLRPAIDGGVLAGLTLGEMGDVSARTHAQFVEMHRSLGEKVDRAATSTQQVGVVAKHLTKLAWGSGRTGNEFREAVLRVKSFYHLEGLAKSNPAAYAKVRWASRAEELTGLTGARRSAKLSRELLGDYGAISVLGQLLRRDFIPFWSWVEINPRTWARMLGNVWGDTDLSVGQKTVKSLPAAGKIAGRMFAVWVLMKLWNRLWLDDEDRDKMNEYAKKSGYLAVPFSKDAQGGSRYIRVASGLSDMAEWVGMQDWPELYGDWKKGRIGWMNLAAFEPKVAINKMAQGLNPLLKFSYEQASGKSLFPDVWRQRPLGKRDVSVAAMWGMDQEYVRLKDWWTPVPTKGIGDWVLSMVGTKYNDPGAAVYGEAMDRKRMFLERVLGQEGGASGYATPKAEMARMYRLAVRYGDADAKKRLQAALLKAGVKGQQGLKDLLESADPRAGIPKKYFGKYEAWMSPEERRIEAQARRYYESTFRV